MRKRTYEAEVREPYMGNTVRVIVKIFESGEERPEKARTILVGIDGAPSMQAKEIENE